MRVPSGRLDAATVRERLRQTPMRESLIVKTFNGLARAEGMAAAAAVTGA